MAVISTVLMFFVGLFVNIPYALITTSVSADLGTRPDLRNSNRALATVTGIIDGTGSIGLPVNYWSGNDQWSLFRFLYRCCCGTSNGWASVPTWMELCFLHFDDFQRFGLFGELHIAFFIAPLLISFLSRELVPLKAGDR